MSANKLAFMPASIRYRFTQKFAFSAKDAYDWCTDFEPQDHKLMGDETATRQIVNVAEGMVILNEVFQTPNGDFEKQKIVHLYPQSRSWVSTHLTGPNKHSQFTYQITPEKGGSKLEFTALHIDYGKNLTTAEVKTLSERLCREDAEAWRLLAEAMTKDLRKQA
jgi:hypothetical protein